MKALAKQTITIPAAAGGQSSVVNVAIAGQYFYCESASSNFSIQFDGHAVVPIQPPMKIPGTFGRLTFFNSSSSANTVSFYVSDTPIEAGATSGAQIQNSLGSCVASSVNQTIVTVTTAGTPVRFASSSGTYARQIIAIPQKTVAPATKGGSANTGNVYVGVSGPTADQQPLPLLPGVPFVFQADAGSKFDLYDFALDVDNSGDSLVIIYW